MATKKLEKRKEKASEFAQPAPAKPSAEESLRRVREFASKRKEKFVAAVRKGED